MVAAAHNLSPQSRTETCLFEAHMAALDKTWVVENTRADIRPRPVGSEEGRRRATRPEGVAAFLSTPIRVGGQPFGILCVGYDHPRPFSSEDREFLEALARRVALAIANARLYQHAGQVAVLEERQRLAHDLHDSVTQALYGLVLFTETARQLARARSCGHSGAQPGTASDLHKGGCPTGAEGDAAVGV